MRERAGRGVTPLCDDATMIISCDSCCMRATATCADCVVTHVLSPAAVESVAGDAQPGETMALDDEDLRVVRLLVRAGMMPTLRHSETDAVTAFC
jgi:hypothetical protein